MALFIILLPINSLNKYLLSTYYNLDIILCDGKIMTTTELTLEADSVEH